MTRTIVVVYPNNSVIRLAEESWAKLWERPENQTFRAQCDYEREVTPEVRIWEEFS